MPWDAIPPSLRQSVADAMVVDIREFSCWGDWGRSVVSYCVLYLQAPPRPQYSFVRFLRNRYAIPVAHSYDCKAQPVITARCGTVVYKVAAAQPAAYAILSRTLGGMT